MRLKWHEIKEKKSVNVYVRDRKKKKKVCANKYLATLLMVPSSFNSNRNNCYFCGYFWQSDR